MIMTDTGKQTALFFGFLTAAMTYASAQATPVQPQPQPGGAAQQMVVQKTEAASKRAARIERELKNRGQRRSPGAQF